MLKAKDTGNSCREPSVFTVLDTPKLWASQTNSELTGRLNQKYLVVPPPLAVPRRQNAAFVPQVWKEGNVISLQIRKKKIR